VVDIPIDAPLLGVRRVYKIKRIQSVYERHKARLVVKGYMQEKGIHYNESFFDLSLDPFARVPFR
jgi:hypothetical protein